MPAWWNSLETVTALTWWLRWIAAGFTIAGGFCVIATLATSKRLDTLREKRDADRHLTASQRAALIEAVKGSQGTFDIWRGDNSNETTDFAEELRTALVEAGWQYGTLFKMASRTGPRGLAVIPQSPDTPRALVLQKALKEIGFPARFEVDADRPVGSMWLYIGAKPKISD